MIVHFVRSRFAENTLPRRKQRVLNAFRHAGLDPASSLAPYLDTGFRPVHYAVQGFRQVWRIRGKLRGIGPEVNKRTSCQEAGRKTRYPQLLSRRSYL